MPRLRTDPIGVGEMTRYLEAESDFDFELLRFLHALTQALGLGLAACQKGLSVSFTTAAALVHELMEARDERRLLRLQKQMAGHKLLIIDELGFVPLSKTHHRGGSTRGAAPALDPLWDELFPAEQARIVHLLVERIDVRMHGVEVRLRPNGLGALVREVVDGKRAAA